MAVTNTTTLASAIATKWIEDLVPGIKEDMLIGKFANKARITRGTGGTLTFNRALDLSPVDWGNLSETTTTSTPVALTTNKQTLTPSVTGDTLQVSKLARLESFLKDDTYKNAIKKEIVQTLERSILEIISIYGLHHRVDFDATYEVSGTVDSGTTTTMVDDALTQSDDHWGTDTSNWGYLAFTNPEAALYDQAFKVTNFTASSDTCTVETMPHAPTSSSYYHLVRGTALAATDVISVAALTRVAALMEYFGITPFEGGVYHGILHPAQKQDLMNDTVFQTIIKYAAPAKLGKYMAYRVFDQEMLVSRQIYREDVDGSKNFASGVVYNCPIFGSDTFAYRNWNDAGDEYGIELNFVGFDKADTGNTYKLQKYISWHTVAGCRVNKATGIIDLMTGATALAAL